SPLSMMPEGLLDTLTPEQIVDLVAYLQSPTQVSVGGPKAPINAATGKVDGALEAETLKIVGKSGGKASGQDMRAFAKDRWSGNDHLWWIDGQPSDKLEVAAPVSQAGRYQLEVVFTKAPDYAIAQVWVNDNKVGEPIDLFDPDVITSGVLNLGEVELADGEAKIGFEIVGANRQAIPRYMIGVDYIRLVPVQ
ncbi:MAG: hypothetical protein KDA87_20120, partial [Planctomycetales bacterium]|nr:hypothetical protein [Planctomycetales bacterium]